MIPTLFLETHFTLAEIFWMATIVLVSVSYLIWVREYLVVSFLHFLVAARHLSVRLFVINICLFVASLIYFIGVFIIPVVIPSYSLGATFQKFHLALLHFVPSYTASSIYTSVTLSVALVSSLRLLVYLRNFGVNFWNSQVPSATGSSWHELLNSKKLSDTREDRITQSKKSLLIWSKLGILFTISAAVFFSSRLHQSLLIFDQGGGRVPFSSVEKAVRRAGDLLIRTDFLPVLDMSSLVPVLDEVSTFGLGLLFLLSTIIPMLIFSISIRNALYILERVYYTLSNRVESLVLIYTHLIAQSFMAYVVYIAIWNVFLKS